MPFFKILPILAIAILVPADGAWAGPAAAGGGNTKAQPATAQAKEPKPARQALDEAPIVMGRSVAVQRKSKLHHIKVKPTPATVSSKN